MSTDTNSFIKLYLEETISIARSVNHEAVGAAIALLSGIKPAGGRLFVLGVGGSAANASHAVNDFRKIAGIEAYAPTDNVAELTAWANDAGWEETFCHWLRVSKVGPKDGVLVLSVGGGSATTSRNLVLGMQEAKAAGAGIVSIVSRDGGKALELSDVTIQIPVVDQARITPHAEGWQAVLWHLMVNALA